MLRPVAAAALAFLLAHPAAALTTAQAAQACVPTASIEFDGDPDPADRCIVAVFAPIPHTAPQLFYQHQLFLTPDQARQHPDPKAALDDPDGNDGAGMAVLQAGRNGLTILAAISGQDAYFNPPPHIEATPQGPILLIPASAIATSDPDLSIAMRRLGGRWVTIEDAWSATLAARLPKGVAQWKGGLMDWRTLTASSALWHDTDANCCPTGGHYTAQLRLAGAKLVLVWLPSPPAGLAGRR